MQRDKYIYASICPARAATTAQSRVARLSQCLTTQEYDRIVGEQPNQKILLPLQVFLSVSALIPTFLCFPVAHLNLLVNILTMQIAVTLVAV